MPFAALRMIILKALEISDLHWQNHPSNSLGQATTLGAACIQQYTTLPFRCRLTDRDTGGPTYYILRIDISGTRIFSFASSTKVTYVPKGGPPAKSVDPTTLSFVPSFVMGSVYALGVRLPYLVKFVSVGVVPSRQCYY
jgi:hypothetical protein